MSPQDKPVSPACPTHHVPVCPTHWSGMVCVISGMWQSGGRSRVTLARRFRKARPVLGRPCSGPPRRASCRAWGRRVAEAEPQPLETAARERAGAGAGASPIPDPWELQVPHAPCRGELLAALGNQHTWKHARSGSGRFPGPAGQLSEVLPPAPQPRASALSRDQHRACPCPAPESRDPAWSKQTPGSWDERQVAPWPSEGPASNPFLDQKRD